MTKQIIITVSPTGETAVQTTGFTGASCKDAIAKLRDALGSVASEEKTPEYYTTVETHVDQQNYQG